MHTLPVAVALLISLWLVKQVKKKHFTIEKLKSKCYGRYALVTGATGSLGQELVRQLSKQYKVVALGRDRSVLEMLRNKYGAVTLAYDFTGVSGLSQALEQVLEQNSISLNDVQLAFLNHGSGIMKPLCQFRDHEVAAYISTNFISHAVLVKYLSQNNSCRVLITGSCMAYWGDRNYSFYHICKQSLLEFARLNGAMIINPPTIRGSKFFQTMPPRTGLRRLGNLRVFSTSVEEIAWQMLRQVYQRKRVVNIGLVTKAMSLAWALGGVCRLFW